MENLKTKISPIREYGGGDTPEDWVGAYSLVLNKMSWRNGNKLIIHNFFYKHLSNIINSILNI